MGTPRYGYRAAVTDDGKIHHVPDETEQSVVEHIVAWSKAGRTVPEIIIELEAGGIACRGSRWYRETIHRILKYARRASSKELHVPDE